MNAAVERVQALLRARWIGLLVVLGSLVGAGFAIRWISSSHDSPPPRKVMQYTMVRVAPPPPPPPKAPEPPPPVAPPKEMDEPVSTRVELKAMDLPPDAPPPSGPAAGPLALATEGTGPGDAFNLVGNPGGRGLLSGGGLGEGGDGVGSGGSDASARYGWYFGRMATEIEEVFRRMKKTRTAQVRVELRVWADTVGQITRVQLVRSTGNEELDQAIQSVVGLKLREPLPPDIPMPVVYRFTARRPG